MPATLFERRLQQCQAPSHTSALRGMRRGLEKESLRVTADGKLALTPHPAALGSALKHPYITTDFSEALLEFITPPCDSIDGAIHWLETIHTFTYGVLAQQDERLWVSSMPCVLGADIDIPIAQYGSSHSARMKTIYRIGLGHRYGRLMQTIAGIHYNLSFSDDWWALLQAGDGDNGALQAYKTQRYFDLIRNFRRHIGLLLYLFGASPAVCPSFLKGRAHPLQAFDERGSSLYLPHATSLRMGNLGYQSDAQRVLRVCYNSLDSYIDTLRTGLTRPHPAYEAIGVKDAHGEYRQLNTHLLQIENEFYSSIRPKRVTQPGETAVTALRERGVEYLEVRCMDLNPYLPVGIDADTARVLEAFLLWCLLSDSPLTDDAEYERITRNQMRCVERGRNPALQLETATGATSLHALGLSMFDAWCACAALLDTAHGGDAYQRACQQLLRTRLVDPDTTPSARVLRDMREQGTSFFRLTREHSQRQADAFAQRSLDAEQARCFADSITRSLAEQAEAEAASQAEPFEDYLARYFSQYDTL